VCPDTVYTDMTKGLWEEYPKLQPEDVAECVDLVFRTKLQHQQDSDTKKCRLEPGTETQITTHWSNGGINTSLVWYPEKCYRQTVSCSGTGRSAHMCWWTVHRHGHGICFHGMGGGDKQANKRQLHTALKLCIDAIFELARAKGMQLVFTTTSEEALQKRYIKYHGMELTENHVKTFLKDLTKDKQYASRSLDWISDDTQISIQRTNNK
jgi:hypothetical protein